MGDNYNTIIIGAGVAGMTAALYLKRAGISTLLIEKEVPGGQITRTASIENYPGFTSITGTDLAMNIYNQLTSLKVSFLFSEVLSINQKKNEYEVITNKKTISCKNIIIATGRNPKKLEIENEDKLTGKGISWCAICDGPLYKDKKVAVIGGGRAALEESLYLSKICSEVTLIHRRDSFRAENELVDVVKSTPNIKVITDVNVKKFLESENRLSGIEFNDHDNDVRSIEVEGCFEYIGQTPSTKNFKELNIIDDQGYVIVDENYETTIPNIYAVGDCLKKDIYQIITACNDGIIVANKIIKKQ